MRVSTAIVCVMIGVALAEVVRTLAGPGPSTKPGVVVSTR